MLVKHLSDQLKTELKFLPNYDIIDLFVLLHTFTLIRQTTQNCPTGTPTYKLQLQIL